MTVFRHRNGATEDTMSNNPHRILGAVVSPASTITDRLREEIAYGCEGAPRHEVSCLLASDYGIPAAIGTATDHAVARILGLAIDSLRAVQQGARDETISERAAQELRDMARRCGCGYLASAPSAFAEIREIAAWWVEYVYQVGYDLYMEMADLDADRD
jgi:hypothetical protein